MLTKRIIPCLDVKDGRVVKGVNFVSLRDAGDPVEAGAAYSREGADELVFLDITATSDARKTVADMVRRVAEKVFIPFTVGGGIRTVDDMRAILREGADKVSVNSAAVKNPELIREGAEKFGSQCITVAIDAKMRTKDPADGWTVVIGRIAESVDIPVIASGGAGTKEHFYDALTEGKADAALAASLFHFRELSIREVKEYLACRNVPVRLV